MERAIQGMELSGSVEDALIAKYERANPPPLQGPMVAPFQQALADATQFQADAEAFQQSTPYPGAEGLANDAQEEIDFAQRVLDGRTPAGADLQAMLDGINNNLRGIQGEMNTAAAEAEAGNEVLRMQMDIEGSDSLGEPIESEVDTVSLTPNGTTRWVDSKAYSSPFGTGSRNWTNTVLPQVEDQLQLASQPQYLDAFGNPPQVVINFGPAGVGQSVANALQAMGVEVLGPVIPGL